jgi:hypothetical protein
MKVEVCQLADGETCRIAFVVMRGRQQPTFHPDGIWRTTTIGGDLLVLRKALATCKPQKINKIERRKFDRCFPLISAT